MVISSLSVWPNRFCLLKEEEVGLGVGFNMWRLSSSIKRENSHCFEQGENLRVQGTEFSELPELTVFSSPSMYSVLYFSV